MANQPAAQVLLQAALDAYKLHGGYRPAAASLGLSYTTLRDRVMAARRLGMDPGAETVKTSQNAATIIADAKTEAKRIIDEARAAEPLVDKRNVFLQDKVTRLERELKEITRNNLEAESVRETIFGLAAQTPAPPDWTVKLTQGQSVTGVPCTIWSDWHLGEVVRKAEVNGVNEFNLDIAKRRIRTLVDRTADLCFKHMTSPSYPGIVVNILGDIVSGDIHEELQQTNETELFHVIIFAVNEICAALREMANMFGRVYVPTAPGNHGRMTRRPQAKRYVAKNADWLIYCLVERHFREAGDDRVQFGINDVGECHYRVYHHRYFATHGDQMGVKGGDGIIGPLGPITRGAIKTQAAQSHMGLEYDTLLEGHWHQMLWLPHAIVNNTLKGFDEYAFRQLRASPSIPSQALWFTHPELGITARWEVLLERRYANDDAPWCGAFAGAA